MEFAYDGGGPAKGGTVTLHVDGDKTGGGRVSPCQAGHAIRGTRLPNIVHRE